MATDKQLDIIIKAHDQASKELKRVQRLVGRMQKGVTRSFKAIRNAGRQLAIGIGIASTAIVAIGYGAIKTAGQLESAEKAFEGLFGSAEEAGKTMDRIKKEAAATPFELIGLTDGVKQLSSVVDTGDEAIDILLNVGRAVTASGGGQQELNNVVFNLKQIKGIGKLDMIDLKQLQRAVPMFDKIVAAAGTTIEEIRASDDVAGALFGAFEKGGKAIEAVDKAFILQAGTFVQLVSNMKDTWVIFTSDIVKETGIFDAVKNALATLIDFMDLHKDTIIRMTKEGIQKLVIGFNQAKTAIISFWTSIQPHVQPAIDMLVKFFSEAENRKETFLVVLTIIGVALAVFVAKFVLIGIAIIAAISLIVAAVHMMRKAWENDTGGIRTAVQAMWNFVKKVFNIMKPFIEAVLAYIGQIIKFWVSIFKKDWEGAFEAMLTLMEIWKKLAWNIFKAAMKVLWAIIKWGLGVIKNYFSSKLSEIASNVKRKMESIKKFFIDPIVTIKDAVVGAMDDIYNAIDKAMSAYSSAKEKAGKYFKSSAVGGSIMRGATHLVGERGPELFTPNTGGTITTASKTAQMGGETNINFNNVNVRNDNDLNTIVNAVKETLNRDAKLAQYNVSV